MITFVTTFNDKYREIMVFKSLSANQHYFSQLWQQFMVQNDLYNDAPERGPNLNQNLIGITLAYVVLRKTFKKFHTTNGDIP